MEVCTEAKSVLHLRDASATRGDELKTPRPLAQEQQPAFIIHTTYQSPASRRSIAKPTCSLSSPTAAGSYLQTKLSLPPSRAPPCPSAMTKHSSASTAICEECLPQE